MSVAGNPNILTSRDSSTFIGSNRLYQIGFHDQIVRQTSILGCFEKSFICFRTHGTKTNAWRAQLQAQLVYGEPTFVIRTEIVSRSHSREEIQFDVTIAVLKILDILLLALDVRLVLDRREQEMVVKSLGPTPA